MPNYLIIEESLSPVIKFLLNPVPETLQIRGFGTLTDQHKISGPPKEQHIQIYIVRPELESVQMIID